MNRHFQAYNALPCAPLGAPKVAEKQQASDGEWRPLRPGYESRTLAGGATEVRSTPGYLPDAAPSVQREPAYQPEGFGYAHVDHRGHQGEVIPKRTELDPGRVMPEDVHGSEPKPADVPVPATADVPEGATHRDRTGMFYRANGDEAQYWSIARGCWVASCCSANGLKHAGVFTRLHPEPQQ